MVANIWYSRILSASPNAIGLSGLYILVEVLLVLLALLVARSSIIDFFEFYLSVLPSNMCDFWILYSPEFYWSSWASSVLSNSTGLPEGSCFSRVRECNPRGDLFGIFCSLRCIARKEQVKAKDSFTSWLSPNNPPRYLTKG